MDALFEGLRLQPFFLSLALVVFSAAPQAAEWTPMFRVSSESYSEPVSIKGAVNDWQGSYRPGERQWTSNWIEAGVRHGAVGVSAFARCDADLRFSRATSDLYWSVMTKRPLEIGRAYDVDIHATSYSASGVRFSLESDWLRSNFKLITGVSLMTARTLQEGRLTGRAVPSSEKDFDFNMSVDYRYDEDRLFDRPAVVAPEGLGLALDLGGDVRLAPRWKIDFEVRDLLGFIRWPDAPYTTATAANGIKTYDSDGYVKSISPLLSGREGYETYTQRLTPSVSTKLQAPFTSALDAVVAYKRQYEMDMGGIGFSTVGKSVNLAAVYWPTLSSIGVELKWQRLTASITVDRVDSNEVRTAWLNLEYR